MKQPATFRIDPNLLARMRAVKHRDGITFTAQLEFALTAWIDARMSRQKARPLTLAERQIYGGEIVGTNGQWFEPMTDGEWLLYRKMEKAPSL